MLCQGRNDENGAAKTRAENPKYMNAKVKWKISNGSIVFVNNVKRVLK